MAQFSQLKRLRTPLSTLHELIFQPRFLVSIYERRHVKLSRSDRVGPEAAWRAFVRSAEVERLIVELVAPIYVAYVYDI